MTRQVDVAIVGLGPVGATLAALLGRGGVSTLVIDKADDMFPLPRAIGFDHEVMRVLQNLGLAEAVAPFTLPYRPTEYHGVDGKLIARYASVPPPYPLGWEPSFVFTQPPFERILRALLDELPSVEVRLSTELRALTEAPDHVVLDLIGPSGEAETVRARYAVGCDGGNSQVRRLLGIGLESLNFDEPWLVVDMLVNEDKLDALPQTIIQYCDPARPTTYVIGPGNHRRWELMLRPGEDPAEMSRDDVIWRLLNRWLTPEDATLWRAATYVFHALIADDWRRDRVFLAGDAAHMTPPFMAQGMCQGIRDAANLAWKLQAVLGGQCGDGLLDSYQAERRPHVMATTETAKALGQIICEQDEDRARARDARMLAQFGDPPQVQIRQNMIPPLETGALVTEQGAPVGARFPQPRIQAADGGTVLLDDVTGAGFVLLLTGSRATHDLPEALQGLVATLGARVVTLGEAGPDQTAIREADGLLAGWCADNGLVAALIRPDHYVLAVARGEGDLAAMATHAALHLSMPLPAAVPVPAE